MDFIQFFLKVTLPKVVIYQRNSQKDFLKEESQFREITNKKNMVKITRRHSNMHEEDPFLEFVQSFFRE